MHELRGSPLSAPPAAGFVVRSPAVAVSYCRARGGSERQGGAGNGRLWKRRIGRGGQPPGYGGSLPQLLETASASPARAFSAPSPPAGLSPPSLASQPAASLRLLVNSARNRSADLARPRGS
eukprot:767968-Hanusia_phi.AAC.2